MNLNGTLFLAVALEIVRIDQLNQNAELRSLHIARLANVSLLIPISGTRINLLLAHTTSNEQSTIQVCEPDASRPFD